MASSKNQKHGRNKRSPSCKNQAFRSKANKEKAIKKEKKRQATKKEMKVHRGTMRKYKRKDVNRKEQPNGIL